MWPRSAEGERRERHKRRIREIALVKNVAEPLLAAHRSNGHRPQILEVGTGNGFQLPTLRELGNVVATDLVEDAELKPGTRPFVLCDISRAPFKDQSFDLIFSSHVLQIVGDLQASLRESRRVCTTNGYVASVVPTSLWIWLTIPSQVLDKAKSLFQSLLGRRPEPSIRSPQTPSSVSLPEEPERSSLFKRFLPRGHGRYRGFWQFHKACRAAVWRSEFEQAGLSIVHEEGLMLYGPSQWPIVPTNRVCAKIGISSGRLFVLRPN